jgi:stage II sporulation protein AA (anti-sigma F factor antagonist)
MEIMQSQSGGAVVLFLSGRVNSANASELEARLQSLAGSGCRAIVLDLAGLDHMTSAGFRCLLRAERQAAETSGRLVLCGLHDLVRELFEISGLLGIFTVTDTREEAIRQAAG